MAVAGKEWVGGWSEVGSGVGAWSEVGSGWVVWVYIYVHVCGWCGCTCMCMCVGVWVLRMHVACVLCGVMSSHLWSTKQCSLCFSCPHILLELSQLDNEQFKAPRERVTFVLNSVKILTSILAPSVCVCVRPRVGVSVCLDVCVSACLCVSVFLLCW